VTPGPTRGQTLARAGLIVSAGFLVSRLLGWIRLVVIGYVFEPQELDTFFAAFRIPDLVFQLVAAGALGSALIPILAGLMETGRYDRAWQVASTVANTMLVALLTLAALLFVFAPVVVPAITPGFDAAQAAQTVELTRLMLLAPIFLALGAIATSVLNAAGRFAAAALAPAVYNIVIIASALLLAPSMGVDGLAAGVALGAVGLFLVQLPGLARLGARYAARIDRSDPEARTAFRLLAPRAIGLGASQITFIVVTSLASLLGAGAITAYNIAFTLLQVPMGLIGVPLGVVLFPSLSRDAAVGRDAEYVSLLTRALRLLLFVMIPAAALMAILREEIVGVLFPAFDPPLRELTANTLLFFLAGLPAHALIAVLARAFYARQDTRTPVMAAVLAVLLNTSTAALLVGPLGLAGIALAIAFAAWVEAIVLLVLKARSVRLAVGAVARVGVTAALATAASVGVGLVVSAALAGVLGGSPRLVALAGEAIVVAVAFGATYLAASVALRIPELASIVAIMSDLVRRRAGSG
jgi:putative peptidoglycan lipid II flippase